MRRPNIHTGQTPAPKRNYSARNLTTLKNAILHEEKLRKMIGEELALGHMAAELGCAPASVRRWLVELGLPVPTHRKPRGQSPQIAKQTEEFLKLRLSGQTLLQIGNQFGVTREYVRQCLQRKYPDTVFPGITSKKRITTHCESCGASFHSRNVGDRFCSTACKRQFRSRINRDTAEQIMRLRDLNLSWDSVASVVKPGVSGVIFRSSLIRWQKVLWSSEEQEKYFPKFGEARFKPSTDA